MVDNQQFIIKIKTSDVKDLELLVSNRDTVHDLRQSIKKMLAIDLQQKNIRLVSLGKLLDPPSKMLVNFNITAGSFVHAVITNAPSSASRMVDISESSQPSSGSSATSRMLNVANLRGLDQLLSDGLTVDEVAAIRSSFRESIDQHALSSAQREDEDSQTYRSRIEEEWMAAQSPISEFALNLPSNSARSSSIPVNLIEMAMARHYIPDTDQGLGTSFDFIWGFATGFMLGFVMIFCIWDRNVTHRQKVGILTGIIFQLLFGLAQGEGDMNSRSHRSSVRNSVDATGSGGASTSNANSVPNVIDYNPSLRGPEIFPTGP